MTVALYNPFDATQRANPYPALHATRAVAGAYRLPDWQGGQWLLTRHRDVRRLITLRAFVVDDVPDRLAAMMAGQTGFRVDRLVRNTRSWLFFADPPRHSALRALVQPRFSPARMGQLRAMVRDEAERLIAAQGEGPVDLIAGFARPLPGRVMGRLLGLDREDSEDLTQQASDLFRMLVPPQSAATYARLDGVVQEVEALFDNVLRTKAAEPEDDVLSDLAAAGTDAPTALGLTAMLFSVGQDTTENLIGNALLALLTHPTELARLRSDPSLIGAAVDEAARYDTPVQGVARRCVEPVEVAGETIMPGERTLFMLAAANRDPDQFDEPDAFLIMRRERSSLPFGGGVHFCLGAHLAKLIAEEAIGALLDHVSELNLIERPLAWRNVILMRALVALPVTLQRHSLARAC